MDARKMMIGAAILAAFVMSDAAYAKSSAPEKLSFGPTGITGIIGKNSIKVETTQSGSPSAGKLKKGDEIIGAGSAAFKDVKLDMVKAIDAAETETAGGKMQLMLKGGKSIEITLPVLGSYSATAPWNCPKSDKIITMTAEYLLKSKEMDSGLHTGLLGLMATGEKKYIDAVGEVIKKAEWAKIDQAKVEAGLAGEESIGSAGWSWGYHLITLAEYYLLTGDKSVLPAIETYAVGLARGQDAGGLYGHRLTSAKLQNRLRGYAQMNQPSLSCFMGMLMAAKCGIKDPALTKGIQTTYTYVKAHIGEGSFPYGVHGPNSAVFNNNGTSGSAAICLALAGNTEGAKFFSQLSATSYEGLEQGHCSAFFNPLWTIPGANLSGPEVSQQFFRKSLWYFNLRRNYDGSWSGDEAPGPMEGVALLAYCLPRKALLITGREADPSIWVKGQAATDVIMASKIDYKSKTPAELESMALNHYLPQVRRNAAGALGEYREKLEPLWTKYLREGTPEQKKLAINQYGWWIKPEVKLPRMEAIGAILRNSEEPADVRVVAAGALAYMGETARKYYPDIVKLMAEKGVDVGKDANVLCSTPFTSGLVPDKSAHYKAALMLIRDKRQNARAEGLRMLQEIPLEDFYLVADDVIHVIADDDATYHSYHNPSKTIAEGIAILAHLNIREGLDYTMQIGKNPWGKGSFRMQATWASLSKYGGNAKDALGQYRERMENRTDFGRHTRTYNAMVKAVEGDKNPPKLISLDEAIKAGKK